MEIAGEDGSKLSLNPGSKAVYGRGNGLDTGDRTVSRRHVSFELEIPTDQTAEPRVSFEVLGKNPIWVRSQTSGKIRIFRKFEKGEVTTGDRFCVSGQRPVWFALKRREVENEVSEESVSEIENGFDSFDISHIDPVKEFGFLVIGKEFHQYPKNKIRDIKQWDWFLDEPRKDDGGDDDDGDEVVRTGKKGIGRKRSRRKGNEDEDWTGESEDDKEVIASTRKVPRPKYSTRLKDPKRPRGDAKISRRRRVNIEENNDDDDDDDDNDETLGGFIVDDDDDTELAEGDESSEEEEEEEEEEEDFDVDDED